MRVAYADPPYYGYAKYYNHPDAVKYDTIQAHEDLIAKLYREFPDGWAMSLSSSSLHAILPHCTESVRVAAWVKPFCSFKPNVNPAYAWEPVIWIGGRQPRARTEQTVRDWCSESITLQVGLTGAKPVGFCYWLFDLLGLQPDDEFVDLFPGSGNVSLAWQAWKQQLKLFA